MEQDQHEDPDLARRASPTCLSRKIKFMLHCRDRDSFCLQDVQPQRLEQGNCWNVLICDNRLFLLPVFVNDLQRCVPVTRKHASWVPCTNAAALTPSLGRFIGCRRSGCLLELVDWSCWWGWWSWCCWWSRWSWWCWWSSWSSWSSCPYVQRDLCSHCVLVRS